MVKSTSRRLLVHVRSCDFFPENPGVAASPSAAVLCYRFQNGGFMSTGKRRVAQDRSPWASGTFYLLVLVVAVVLACAAARLVALWLVPVLLIAALLALTVVGALQLKQDDRISEKGFLALMAL